jgi:hypothetical protein
MMTGSMRPALTGTGIDSAVTDLPQPDSPTMPASRPPDREERATARPPAPVEVRAEIGDGEGRLRHRPELARVQRLRKPSATIHRDTVITGSAGRYGNYHAPDVALPSSKIAPLAFGGRTPMPKTWGLR